MILDSRKCFPQQAMGHDRWGIRHDHRRRALLQTPSC